MPKVGQYVNPVTSVGRRYDVVRSTSNFDRSDDAYEYRPMRFITKRPRRL